MNLKTFRSIYLVFFILFISVNGMHEIKKVNDISRFYKDIMTRFVNAEYNNFGCSELLHLELCADLSNTEKEIFNIMKENASKILKKECKEKYFKKVSNKDYRKPEQIIKYMKYISKDIVSMLKAGWALVPQDDQAKISNYLKNDNTEVNEWYCIKKRQALFNENLLLNSLIEELSMKASLHCYSEKVQNPEQTDIEDIYLCIKKSDQERFNDFFEFTISLTASH